MMPIPQPIHPIQFCEFWVPRLRNDPKAIAQFKLRCDRVGSNERDELQTLSIKLLQVLFPEHTYSAIHKWFAYERCPYTVQVALGACDRMWKQREFLDQRAA